MGLLELEVLTRSYGEFEHINSPRERAEQREESVDGANTKSTQHSGKGNQAQTGLEGNPPPPHSPA